MELDPQVLALLRAEDDAQQDDATVAPVGLDPAVLSILDNTEPPDPSPAVKLDPEVLGIVAKRGDEIKIRRDYLRDKYIPKLIAPLFGERRKWSKQAIKEITDPEEREWLIGQVREYSKARAWAEEEEYNRSGYFGRLSKRGQQVGGAFATGAAGQVGALTDFIDWFEGRGDTMEEVQFKRELESAKQTEDPSLGRDPSWALQGAAGATGMTPDLSAGLLVGVKGGAPAMFAYWTARIFPERRDDFIEMGFSPAVAATAGAVTAAGEAAIELINIGPPGLKKLGGEVLGKGVIRRGVVEAIEKFGGKRLKAIVGKNPVVAKVIGEGVDAAERIFGEVSEEGLQRGVGRFSQYFAAKADDDIEGPIFADIAPEMYQSMVGSAPGIIALGTGSGGGMMIGEHVTARQEAKQERINKEILSYADEGKTPSRTTRRGWGFPEEGWRTAEQRLDSVQHAAEEIRAEERIEAETQAMLQEPPVVAEAVAEEPLETEVATEARILEGSEGAAEAAEGPVRKWDDPVSPGAADRIEAQRAADAGIEPGPGFLAEETGAKPIGERFADRERPDIIAGGKPLDLATGDAEVDRRLKKSSIVAGQAKGIKKRVGDALETAWRYTTRAHVHLPLDDEHATARETFRLLKAVPQQAVDEAIRTVATIVVKLGTDQVKLFESAIVAQNQARTIKRNAELPPENRQSLRHGFTPETAAKWYDKVFSQVEATPVVKEALELRGKVVRGLVTDLVERNMLPESTLVDPEGYFHQQVNMTQEAKRRSGRLAGVRRKKRGFQKKRTEGRDISSEEYDYSTSYVTSESEWFADSFAELAKADLLETLLDRYEVTEEFKAEAKKAGMALEDFVKLQSEFGTWQIRPGSPFYRAFSIPEKIGEQLQKGIIEEANLTADEVRQVIAIGGKYKTVVLPQTVIDQLEATEKSTDQHWLEELHRQAMSAWKGYVLLNPKRIIGYNVRNFTGDVDPVLAADPKILKAIPQAFKELWGYHRGNLALSPRLREARNHGVTTAGFLSGEISETSELQIFRRLKPAEQRSLMKNPLKLYMEVVRPYVEMRENILRYAAFLTYYDQIEAGELSHYGAAKKSTVETLAKEMGTGVAAAHMSRELLGDYGNMTAAGEFMRSKLFPFWAFQEINIKRYPKLTVNAIRSGEGRGRTGAVLSAVALSRMGGAYAAWWTWNNLIYPALFGSDDEDKLGDFDKANPHLLLGPNADGTFKVFRNVGALGDFLEWFGINEAISLLDEYKAGQVELGDVGKEMGAAWIEKAVGLLRPDVKAGYEVVTGQSLFPTPFKPRSVERDVAVANVFALGDEWKAFKGLVAGEGNRARKHYWKRWLVGVVDPRQTSLGEMYDARRRFLESKGIREGGVYPVSEYKQARDAASNEDYAAFAEWKSAFQERHGPKAVDKFRSFLSRLDPIASRLNDADEVEFESEFLTAEQRAKLMEVRDYAAGLEELLVQWWVASEQEPPLN